MKGLELARLFGTRLTVDRWLLARLTSLDIPRNDHLTDRGLRQLTIGLALLLVAVSTSSCQTITKIKCVNKDWVQVGEADGKSGKIARVAFDEHNSECAAAGSAIDQSVYMQGYQTGLQQFCTYDSGRTQALGGMINNDLCAAEFGGDFDNGFTAGLTSLCTAEGGRQLGIDGKAYRETCPMDAQADFLAGYTGGLNTYIPVSETKLGSLRSQMITVDTSLSRVRSDISSYDSAIKRAKKSNNAALKKQLESSRSPLSVRQSSLEREKRKLKRQIAELESGLEVARDMLVKWGGS